ncbi:MAG TPA: acyl-CoA dehydrogenase family protein [Pseudonocardiaceae bacterium]|nr:acyl-CoA dehydrogenase family protein [Pseudonocardiaceae bacterium]
MELVLTPEQEDLRSTVRKFLRAESPMTKVRAAVDGEHDFDPALWRRLAGELGLVGLTIPDRYDGVGAGQIERSIVLEEMGRALLPAPYLSTVLAADALLALDDEPARAELLPAIAAGELRATVAIAEGSSNWAATDTSTTATPDPDGWRLNGSKNLVLDGASADLLIVLANSPEGPAFFRVAGDAGGLSRTPLTGLDPTRRFARIDLNETPAIRIAAADPVAALEKIIDLATLALAAESIGVLGQAMRMAVDYAKVRVQFGRYIGSYQAVKHLCVDSYVDYELTCSVLRNAAWAADHDPAEFPLAAAHARVSVLPAAFQAAVRNVQVHGGIGYTWEHDAHLYYKRAKSNELLLGNKISAHLALADRLGI